MTEQGASRVCPKCQAPVVGAGRFCVRCGTAIPSVPTSDVQIADVLKSSATPRVAASTALAGHQAGATNPAVGPLPGDVLAVAALAVVCGVLLAWPNGRALWNSLRYLTQAHYGAAGERLAELSVLTTALVPVAVAVGLVVCG